MANLNKHIGLRLKIARKSAGYNTAIEFSTKFNIPKSTYAQHESGNRSLTAELIIYYTDLLCLDPGWLLTGYGYPCPLDKNKNMRKKIIDEEIKKLQEGNKLLRVPHTQILSDDTSASINMELFKLILITAFKAVMEKKLSIEAEELINFCIDVYNNVDILSVPMNEKEKIIELSLKSMLRGPKVIIKNIKQN